MIDLGWLVKMDDRPKVYDNLCILCSDEVRYDVLDVFLNQVHYKICGVVGDKLKRDMGYEISR
jgi:hypothetical protein